jgi:hypothetical protein
VQAKDETASYRKQNRTTAQLALWTLAWVATLAAARFGPELLWNAHPAASWIAVAVNILVGAVWIVTFARFLRAQDELWRKIMLDALAVTLGVGFVVGFGYFVAEAAGLVTYDLNIALFPVLLAVAYVIIILVGWIRYR